MTWTAALLVVLSPLAGSLLWSRFPPGDDEAADHLETVFASLLCAVFVTGGLALLLAELGALRPLPLAACLGSVIAALWWLPRRSPTGTRPSRWHAGAAALVATLAVVSLAPASEDLLGGRDPGTYANTASWIARNGTLQVYSEPLTTVGTGARNIFYSSVLLPGFYVGNVTRGEVIPQFLHLHPTCMALGYWLGGPIGGFLVPPFIGVLAELAVFFFVRRMLGVGAAVIAASVLALNLVQMWGMRSPYSEGLVQLGVFAALWCIAVAHRTKGLRWGALGGIALGTCFLVRVDALLLFVAIAPALVMVDAALPHRQRWITHAFLPLSILLALWSAAHAWLFSRPYVIDLADLIRPLWALSAIMAAVCAVALVARVRLRTAVDWMHGHGTRVWIVTAVTLCAAFAIGMWVRPHIEPFATSARYGRTHIEDTLARVGWYFSTTGVIVALGGVVLILRRWLTERHTAWLPFLSPLLAFSFLYFWNHRIHPDHPWMMRRFLPVIVPGMAVSIAAAVAFAWAVPGRWRKAARVAAIASLGTVLVHEAAMAAPFWNFREKRGVIRQLTEFAQHVPERSLLLFSYPGTDHYVTTPLAFYWRRPVLPVLLERHMDPEGERRRGRFETQVLRWLQAGRDVLYLTANDADSTFLAKGLRWEEVASLELEIPTFGSRYDSAPRAPLVHTEQYRLMRAVSALDQPLSCAGSTLHVDGRLRGATQGFHRPESSTRERFYWARPEARLMFASCDRTGAGRPVTMRVYAACGRLPAEGDCRVAVAVNGEPAGILHLTRGFADHDLQIPPAAVAEPLGPVEIRFHGPRVVPSDSGLPDDRVLSFQLTSVTLRASRGPDGDTGR